VTDLSATESVITRATGFEMMAPVLETGIDLTTEEGET
jgi:hypothetical protein